VRHSTREVGVLVVGGGSAGVAAAVAAAREGVDTVLIERYGFLGGMATAACVGTVCGLYFRGPAGPRYACAGFGFEFAERLRQSSLTEPVGYKDGLWFLPYRLPMFVRLCDQLTEAENLEVCLHATLTDVTFNGETVEEVRVLLHDSLVTFRPTTVVDCTGMALASRLAGSKTEQPGRMQAAAAVFGMAGIEPMTEEVLRFLLIRELRRGVNEGALSEACERLSVVPGSQSGDEVLFKVGLPLQGAPNVTDLEIRARALIESICEFLVIRVTGFSNARISFIASQVGIRGGPRPIGAARLSDADVMQCAKPDDGVAIGAWPVEEWGEERGPKLGFFKEDDVYVIAAGALQSERCTNLLFAGRSLSASDAAVASARVIGTCLSTGYAAGVLAAFSSIGRSRVDAIAAIRSRQVEPVIESC
jgi:hypothetical protein